MLVTEQLSFLFLRRTMTQPLKQDWKHFSKIFKLSIHPLHEQVPKAKVIDYNLRYKNSARMLINTKRFKSVSMRKPGRTRQEVIQLKSPISLKLGTNVGFGE